MVWVTELVDTVRLLPRQRSRALPWYRIDDATFDCGPFDLVIVDGPPAYEPGTEQSRAPALPVLLSHLSADGVLILTIPIETAS